MNKWSYILSLSLIFGCGDLKKNTAAIKKNNKSSSIVAKVSSDLESLSFIKIKSKIKLNRDSIIVSVHPFLGIEMGRAIFKDNKILIYNHYSNTVDSLDLTGTRINPKRAAKFFISQKPRDSIVFNHSGYNCVFKNYKEIKNSNKKNLFLPHTISINDNKNDGFNIHVDYESIQIFDNIK